MAYRPIGEGIIESYGSLQDDTGMLLINSSHEVQPQLGSLITDIPTHQPEWDENESGTFQGGWTDQSPNSFMNVETPQIGSDTFGDDSTARALEKCKKTVLRPYHIFLKCIGWRKFTALSYDLRQPLHYRCINMIWPLTLTTLLFISCITQVLLCFSRDLIRTKRPSNETEGNETFLEYHISCSNHVMTWFVALDVVLISAYLYGMYIFRFKLPEHLSTFAETVFLGTISRKGDYSPKYLIRSLQLFLLLAMLWIIFSFMTSIVRIFAHHLDQENVSFEFISSPPMVVRIILVIISLVGFVVFDIAYSAAVINYAMQCQLMVYYLKSICTRILAREWEIDEAIKQIHTAKQFLFRLNSHLSRAVGMMIFIFLYSSIMAIYGLQRLHKSDPDLVLIAISESLAVIQWALWLFIPLIQASRVTNAGYWLKKTALEVRSRPFNYKDTPQLDLDSFVTYCSNVQLQAKLISVPITPWLVAVGFFSLAIALFLLFQFENFSWAKWL